MKAVLGMLKGMERNGGRDGEPRRSRALASAVVVDVSTTSTSPTAHKLGVHGTGAEDTCAAESTTSRDDGRAGLMSRQVGSLNVWKAPVEGPPVALRYAKRCSRSPSPIPRRKVSFRLSAAGTSGSSLLPSLTDTEHRLDESFSSFDDTTSRTRRSDNTHSMTESTSSSMSSMKSSLKVSRQSLSVVRTYDPATILHEDDEKRVAFSSVSVHLHPMTLGDNPAVSAGVPVQIEWKPTTSFTRPLDEYETAKDRPPRSAQQLRLGPTRRENILKEAGQDRGEVRCVLRSVAHVQASRAKNAGAVSVDASSRKDPPAGAATPASQRIRSGAPLPKVLHRFVVNKPSPQPA